MGAPLWTKDEREYFFREVLPHSQYATGEFKPGKRSFGELAPIMQAELDRRGVSKRTYTAKNLFQHYYQKFGRLGRLKALHGGEGKSHSDFFAIEFENMSESSPALDSPFAETEKFPTVSLKRSHPVERPQPGEAFFSDACTQTDVLSEPVKTIWMTSKRRRTLENGSPSPAGASLDLLKSLERMLGRSATRRSSLDCSIPPPRMNSLKDIRFPGSSSSAKTQIESQIKTQKLPWPANGGGRTIRRNGGPTMTTFRIHRKHTIDAELQESSRQFASLVNGLPKKDSSNFAPQTVLQFSDPFTSAKYNPAANPMMTIRSAPAPTTRAPIDRLLDHISDPSTLEGLPNFAPTTAEVDCLEWKGGTFGGSNIDILSSASRRDRVLEIVRVKKENIVDSK